MEAFLNLFKTVEKVEGGFSNDKLFKCTDEYNHLHLCRFFDIKNMDEASKQYELLKRFKGVKGFQQVEYIMKCQDNLHGVLVYEWVDGELLEIYLQKNPDKQFELGQQAGEILKQLHRVTIPFESKDKYEYRRPRRLETQLNEYVQSGGYFEKMDELVDHFHQHKSNYKVEKMVQTHGDFHSRNMIISHDQITVIDFEKTKAADASIDLSRLIFFDELNFIKGVLDVYQPSLQVIENTKIELYARPHIVLWASQIGLEHTEILVNYCQQVLDKIKEI